MVSNDYSTQTHLISIAPMLDWTNRHCRYLHRLLTKKTLLYTEMVTVGAILNGDPNRFLSFNKVEHPVALQLGGSNPEDLAKAAKLGEDYGYDEINLNAGCPSKSVQAGHFGVAMMLEPQLVADCLAAMKQSVNVPVSIKTRLGVDDHDSYDELHFLIAGVAKAQCKKVIIHARKANLRTFSPKKNRTQQAIDYEKVYQIKKDFPELNIIINGDIVSFKQIEEHLKYVDGVMLGRAAYRDPYLLAGIDQEFYGANDPVKTREQIMNESLEYIQKQLLVGGKLQYLLKPILGLFRGMPNAKERRRQFENLSKMSITNT